MGEKITATFSQSCSEKGGEGVEGGVPDRKKLLPPPTPVSPPSPPFSGRFRKLSVFSRPALSRRREKSLPPNHGPAHTPSANDTD